MTTIQDVHDVYRKTLYIENENFHLIDMALATYISKDFEGDPLFLIGKGASSSGKSVFTEPLRRLAYDPISQKGDVTNRKYQIHHVSKLTPASFISAPVSKDEKENQNDLGYWLQDKDNIGKSSLIIFSDLAPLLTMPEEGRMELFGMFRDLFDGYLKYNTSKGTKFYNNIKVNSLAFSTQLIELEQDMHNLMGTRELVYNLPELKHPEKALEWEDVKADRDKRAEAVKEFLDTIGSGKVNWKLNETTHTLENSFDWLWKRYAIEASQWRSTGLFEENGTRLICQIKPEQPMRIYKQFKKLYKALLLLGVDNPKDYVKYVAHNCGDNQRMQVISKLFDVTPSKVIPEVRTFKVPTEKTSEYDEGFEILSTEELTYVHSTGKERIKTVQEIAYELKISPKTVRKNLMVLWQLGLVEPTKLSSKKEFDKKDYSVLWQPTKKYNEIFYVEQPEEEK